MASGDSVSPPAAPRTPPLTDRPELAARTVALLRTKSALFDLDEAEARCIVDYMRVVNLPRGATVFREGDAARTDHLLLILAGDVSVDMSDGDRVDGLPVSVLGPGSVVGEMALLDGGPRSATCTAMNDVIAAGISRAGLQRLAHEHPQVALRLMVAIAQRVGDRLRALGEQLRLYARLNAEQAARLAELERR
ncbi:MAG: cyclic nucleotide-binding domain-containing protein [Rubrivivax sp.]|nr:cyclic nucleotide-binding domain-containing protein [Rubrivivax sp.]